MDYHKTDLHKRLLKNIALSVELYYNDKDYEICEYDVQAFMSVFLKRNFINTNFSINREIFGKFDCAISQKSSKKPEILYEIKTFLKSKEKLNIASAYKKIEKDLIKLKDGILKHLNSRAYLIIVCKKKDIKKVTFINNLDFVKKHINNSRKWTIKNLNKKEIKIRPSSKILIERVWVLSWEII